MIRWEPKVASFRKNLEFLSGDASKLEDKNFIWRGPGHLVVNINISLLYSYTVANAKILKEPEKT